MEHELTLHARQRMQERSIPLRLVEQGIANPDKISIDAKGVMLLKKVLLIKGRQRLLLIAGQIVGKRFKIFTVIDTSKVKKYL
ncbi:MAG: DUF4258 domain-containing protein [Candidatus Paceibacterales bacterium]